MQGGELEKRLHEAGRSEEQARRTAALTEGGRGTDAIGGALLGRLGAEDSGGGWGISLGLLGPIFSLLSSSGTSPLALWIASICSCRVMLACAACWVRAMLPEWPSQVTWRSKRELVKQRHGDHRDKLF